MRDWCTSPLFGVTLTLVVFCAAQQLQRRTRAILLNAVGVSIAVIILLLKLGGVAYADYQQGGQYIHFLLGPAVVALAVPLYTRRSSVVSKASAICAGVGAGAIVSILSACGLAALCGASTQVILSLAPKSVTMPIALGLSESNGGLPPLTAAVVVISGCLGGICGPEFCRWIGIRDPLAMGLAVGTASHGIGTARILEEDLFAGAIAGLAIGLNGVMTAFLLPLLVKIGQ